MIDGGRDDRKGIRLVKSRSRKKWREEWTEGSRGRVERGKERRKAITKEMRNGVGTRRIKNKKGRGERRKRGCSREEEENGAEGGRRLGL